MHNPRILVWDLPVRVFHWLLAASFAGAFLTAESERWRDVHVLLGYTVAALIAFRLVWAVVGTRYARLSSFAYGPSAVARYLRTLLSGRPAHYVGHNPAGSWAIYALVLLGIATAASGYATYVEFGGHAVEELHEAVAYAMLAVVGLHVAGVVVSSVLHRENLARAMVTGWKRASAGGDDGDRSGIRRPRALVAAMLVFAVVGLWAVGWQRPELLAPDAQATASAPAHHAGVRRGGDDDD